MYIYIYIYVYLSVCISTRVLCHQEGAGQLVGGGARQGGVAMETVEEGADGVELRVRLQVPAGPGVDLQTHQGQVLDLQHNHQSHQLVEPVSLTSRTSLTNLLNQSH